ncbi:MAG: HesA/MoeB/ThiF family protein [Pseudomonadota bacterium]
MLLVFLIAGTIWGIGHAMKVPHQARWLMIGLLYIVVLIEQIALPDGHPLREMTGQSPALWLLLGGFVAVILGYRELLRRLRARAGTDVALQPPRPEGPSEAELTRYARHIVLREIGGPGQMRLRNARVLVVGAGGLGAPALLYLAGAGVGTIGVIDGDVVDGSNLQRQVIHTDKRIGMPKVFSAQESMRALNPFVTVRPYHRRLTEEIVAPLLADYDVVLDGTDDPETRYKLNRAAVEAGVPLVSGAISQWEGQLSVFDPAQGAPCYRCLFPEPAAAGSAPSCAEAGVLGPLPGVIGSMMAVEAVKIVTGAGTSLRGQLLIYDALHGESRRIAISRRLDCPDCGTGLDGVA